MAHKDPVANAVPGQELVYGVIQAAWSAWARRRYRSAFDEVRTYALFVGYPRSGHSIVGAALNAHRDAVISHELDASRLIIDGCSRDVLYSRILARAAWFNLKGNRSNYRYQIPGSWQGRFEHLRVIGDKGGGWVAQWIAEQPDLLARTRATVGVPIRLIHIVRNPFDNIAAISIWHRLSLDDSIAFYFSHCETTGALLLPDDCEVMTLRHEDLIQQPVPTLESLCLFLGLDRDPGHLESCARVVFAAPTFTRRRVAWSAGQVADVTARARRYEFLRGYEYEPADPPHIPAASHGPARATIRGTPLRERVAAWLNPRASTGA